MKSKLIVLLTMFFCIPLWADKSVEAPALESVPKTVKPAPKSKTAKVETKVTPKYVSPPVVKIDKKDAIEEINFETDTVYGSTLRPNDQIREIIKSKTPLPCFDEFSKLLREDAPKEKLKQAYKKTLRCFDSCVTAEDAEFLAQCPDFQCSEKQIDQAIASGAFTDSGTNPATGKCKEPPLSVKVKTFAQKMRTNFQNSNGQCPKGLDQMEVMEELGQGIDYFLKRGYPTDSVPGENFNEGTICGYHKKQGKLYTTEKGWWGNYTVTCPYDGTFGKKNHCIARGPEHPWDCFSYFRVSTLHPFFRGYGCPGNPQKSFHEGGTVGDMRLIPVIEGVWFITLEDAEGAYFFGMVLVR